MNSTKPFLLISLALMSIIGGAILIWYTWSIPIWQGAYCSIGLATTEGCNYSPATKMAQFVAIVLMLVTIPLLASAFALLQNMHLHKHINKTIELKLEEHHQALKDHIDKRLNV